MREEIEIETIAVMPDTPNKNLEIYPEEVVDQIKQVNNDPSVPNWDVLSFL